MSDAVLDASAILALLNDETGSGEVARYIPGGKISSVNLSEVVAKLAENGMPEDFIRQAIGVLGLEVLLFDEKLSFMTGMLSLKTGKKGLSLGDRACMATALDLKVPVVTADRVWQEIGLPMEIRLIR